MLFQKESKRTENEEPFRENYPKGPKKMWVPKVKVVSDAYVS